MKAGKVDSLGSWILFHVYVVGVSHTTPSNSGSSRMQWALSRLWPRLPRGSTDSAGRGLVLPEDALPPPQRWAASPGCYLHVWPRSCKSDPHNPLLSGEEICCSGSQNWETFQQPVLQCIIKEYNSGAVRGRQAWRRVWGKAGTYHALSQSATLPVPPLFTSPEAPHTDFLSF